MALMSDRRAWRAAGALCCCAILAGCGATGTPGFEAQRDNTYALSSIGTKIGNLVSFNTLFPESAPLPQSDVAVACPVIEVQDGTASARFYRGSGQANADVRYAFSLGDVARECSKVGDQLQLKVGVEGRLLIGPAGEPGTFSVPIRIAVRDDNSQRVLSSQLARVSASVPAGGSQAAFTYVTDPFPVTFVPHPDEDYTILVGFDTGGKLPTDATAQRSSRRKKPAG